MRKVFFGLLAVILIFGALGAAGYAGFQYGYRQGAIVKSDKSVQVAPGNGDNYPHGMMPMHDFGFSRGMGRGEFGMMRRGMGFGFFSPLMFLVKIALLGLVIWALYMLVARSGLRIVRTTQTTETPSAPVDTEIKG
jgi:hypothetical protein